MPALRVLEAFKTSQLSILLVVDEHGSVEGLVTGNDILGALVSSVPSAKRQTEPQVVKGADGSWLLEGAVAVDRRSLRMGPPTF